MQTPDAALIKNLNTAAMARDHTCVVWLLLGTDPSLAEEIVFACVYDDIFDVVELLIDCGLRDALLANGGFIVEVLHQFLVGNTRIIQCARAAKEREILTLRLQLCIGGPEAAFRMGLRRRRALYATINAMLYPADDPRST